MIPLSDGSFDASACRTTYAAAPAALADSALALFDTLSSFVSLVSMTV